MLNIPATGPSQKKLPELQVYWCSDSPGFGGAEINLVRVLRMVSGAVRSELLLSLHATPRLVSEIESLHLRHSAVFRGNNRASSFPAGAAAMAVLIAKHWQGVFVIWAHHLDSCRWLQLLLAVLRRKYVLVEQLLPANSLPMANSRLTVPVKRIAARGAMAVVVNGESQRDHYVKMLSVAQDNVIVIRNSRPISRIDAQVASLRSDRFSVRSRLGLTADATVVVCVARLAPEKRQHDLISAVSILSSKGQNVQLVLVGDGRDRQELELAASNAEPGRILFVGEQADILPFLAAADIFVLPSMAEGLPGALIEAMAAGVPCVASDIPGNNELVIHELTGLSYPVGNIELLANHIEDLALNRSRAKQFADSAFALVRTQYDESGEQKNWVDLVGQLHAAKGYR